MSRTLYLQLSGGYCTCEKNYLSKPFRTGELLARIRSALRTSTFIESIPIIACNDLQIDLAEIIVKKRGETIKLTSTEFALLALFDRNEGKVLTHQYLLRDVWGPELILTESGVGYRFVCKNDE